MAGLEMSFSEIQELKIDYYTNVTLKKVKLILQKSDDHFSDSSIVDDFVLQLPDVDMNRKEGAANAPKSETSTFSDIIQIITYLGNIV